MKTLFAIAFLLVAGLVANFLIVFVLNFAGVPGALLAGKRGMRSKGQFVAGALVSAIGQSAVYLAYTAFVVNWTALAVSIQKASLLVWPVAFVAVMLPLWINLIRARLEAREDGDWNAQVEALHVTVLVTFIGFFLFAFLPSALKTAYWWVPYVSPK